MTATLLVGLDGHSSGDRALEHAKSLAKLIGTCEILVVYVIEWSPYSFQTPEENALRHNRRETEIATAMERIIEPALASLKKEGFDARGKVRHGDVADTINAISVEEKAKQIIVNRSSAGGIATRLFGSATANLVMNATVPVTVVG